MASATVTASEEAVESAAAAAAAVEVEKLLEAVLMAPGMEWGSQAAAAASSDGNVLGSNSLN